ncbi:MULTISPECIES: FadR/GntR family transcriptional regulator [unclassified Mycobacterium]|uniref:FadR/GntR family transcriptional regulator n=1 Tax=unclassified Mycobacterium TaxID=2642494 RepID=UPI0029C843D4|nr:MULTISPECIES: FadR/GntR family transcriptional regulator [unclassified Mycobacterium]
MADHTAPQASSRLSDALADRIRELIIRENMAEEARLPSERELAARFGASRPMVSQALRSLSLMGLVEIRRGSGAYVVRRPESTFIASVNLMLELDEHSVDDLLELRFWLESVGVREAATRVPELPAYEKAELFNKLHRLGAAAGNASEWISADTVFHAGVVRAAGNPYLTAVYEGVHTAVLSYEHRQWVQSESVPDWLRHTSSEQQLALHAPILDAVLAGDPDAASVAVTAHHRVMVEHLRAAKTQAGSHGGD